MKCTSSESSGHLHSQTTP